MKRVSNTKYRDAVMKLEEFKGSNLSGEKTADGKFYVVLSYGWYPLFAWSYELMQWFSNGDRYSSSTSKQRGQAHPHADNIVEVTHDKLKNLIAGLPS